MSHHMLVKINLQWKCCLPLGALIWFLPIMCHHMFITIMLPWISFSHQAHWYCSCPIWVLVWLTRNLSSKCFLTLFALIWFMAIMSPLMLNRITLQWKSFLTLSALIWFLPSMTHHMLVKISLIWKCFLTLGALIVIFEDYQAARLNHLEKCFSEATFLAAALALESWGQHAGAPAEAREYLTNCLSKCKTVIYMARESQMLTRRIQSNFFSCRRQQRSP